MYSSKHLIYKLLILDIYLFYMIGIERSVPYKEDIKIQCIIHVIVQTENFLN